MLRSLHLRSNKIPQPIHQRYDVYREIKIGLYVHEVVLRPYGVLSNKAHLLILLYDIQFVKNIFKSILISLYY